jgi:hypothetical protein
MLKAAPLWKIVARVRFLATAEYERFLATASSYSQNNFSREAIGKPFVPRLDMCPGQEYSQYYCILKGSVFSRQQTSVDAPQQNSSESERHPFLEMQCTIERK